MKIVRAEPSHEPAILALATRTLGWDDDPRFAELYRWKHDRNPFGPSPRWVALDDDGVVIGFRVLLRWRFRRGDEVLEAVRAVDTATDPAHQGRGIFRSLTLSAIEELRDEGLEAVFNTPNDQSRPGYLKMGWSVLGRPPVAMVGRLRSLNRIARSRTPAELWSVPSAVGDAAGPYFADSLRAGGLAELIGADERDRWRTDRGPAWLSWRYGLDDLHYRVLTTDHLGATDDGFGLVVFRLRRRGPSLEATITEALGPTAAVRRRLIRAARRATGADYALVATAGRFDPAGGIALEAFSPLVTWRRVSDRDAPDLDDVRFSLGDLELF